MEQHPISVDVRAIFQNAHVKHNIALVLEALLFLQPVQITA